VDDEDAGQPACRVRRPDEVAEHGAATLSRLILQALGVNPGIGRRDLLRLGELRAQHVEQHAGRDAAHGELAGAVEKPAPVHVPVHVGVEEDQEFRIEVVCGLAFHWRAPRA
jgi:hypothetical protein